MADIRTSPPRIFGDAVGAPRPPAGAPGASAHRQTAFVLEADVELVLAGLALEGDLAASSAAARYRNPATAIILATWSRSWLCRLEALHAVQTGAYPATFPLLRAAADTAAAVSLLLETDGSEFAAYLEADGVRILPEQHATEFALHPYRAAEVLARDETLGRVYRLAEALSMPHLGTTLLLAGNESRPDRVLVTFGDRDFHLGLAELALGWLLELGRLSVQGVAAYPSLIAPPDTGTGAWLDRLEAAVARRDRCAAAFQDVAGESRIVVSNWRRAPGAAPRRIVL